jgi:hypothetical protein
MQVDQPCLHQIIECVILIPTIVRNLTGEFVGPGFLTIHLICKQIIGIFT